MQRMFAFRDGALHREAHSLRTDGRPDVSFQLSGRTRAQDCTSKKRAAIRLPSCLASLAYFFGQPSIVGSFLHCSGVGLSAAIAEIDALANMAASRKAISFFTLTPPCDGSWNSRQMAHLQKRGKVYSYRRRLSPDFARLNAWESRRVSWANDTGAGFGSQARRVRPARRDFDSK
jgi:hypothetical protein